MQDMKAHLAKLRADAAECAMIRDLATDPKKRELFTRLSERLNILANEVEAAVAAALTGGAERPLTIYECSRRCAAGMVGHLTKIVGPRSQFFPHPVLGAKACLSVSTVVLLKVH